MPDPSSASAFPATVAVDDEPSEVDVESVAALLDRRPQGSFCVVVRHVDDGSPVVVRNHPLLADGTPMPTRYWLLGEPERTLVSRLESRGGVHRVEEVIGMEAITEAHQRYATERDAAIPTGWDGPRPTAGVGGTRRGVKCLHAHYGWWLAGGDDPVGRWVAERLAAGDGDKTPNRAENGS
ncbi:hypothetical protein BH23ACT2_BH23ACT2_01150 [soil metagenome]